MAFNELNISYFYLIRKAAVKKYLENSPGNFGNLSENICRGILLVNLLTKSTFSDKCSKIFSLVFFTKYFQLVALVIDIPIPSSNNFTGVNNDTIFHFHILKRDFISLNSFVQ